MTKALPIKQITNNIYHLALDEFSDGCAVYNNILNYCIKTLEIPRNSSLIIEPRYYDNLCELKDEFINYFNNIAYVLSDDGERFDLQFSHAITIKNLHANTFFFNSFDSALEECNSYLSKNSLSASFATNCE